MKANTYTVKLDANSGDKLTKDEITPTFGEPYGELPTPTKAGSTFLEWFTEDNERVTRDTIVSTAGHHTLHARWEEAPTKFVEIIFGTKSLTEAEVKETIKEYTDGEEFEIVRFEVDGSGEIRVIIKFVDEERAAAFIEKVIDSSESAANSLFKMIRFASLSSKAYPHLYSTQSFSSTLYYKLYKGSNIFINNFFFIILQPCSLIYQPFK